MSSFFLLRVQSIVSLRKSCNNEMREASRYQYTTEFHRNCHIFIVAMHPDQVFGGYEKLKTVGKGAFGTATLYRKLDDNKHVVMKEIFTMDMDDSEKKSALNEVEVISALKHPNIIRYIGNFEKDDSLIIIMEYADGGNLAQLINAKKNKFENFTEKGILNIFSQICSAISYMHSCKILHRDLKTPNIFLNLNGAIKVGDFGISKVLNTKSQAHTVVGTPYYLSPEMCEGNDYNDKSDIWAMGCILYELASLKKPFDAPTLPVLVQKITTCEYESISNLYSEDLSLLIKSILQLEASSRPTAKYIHDVLIPKILQKIKTNFSLESSLMSDQDISIPKERSILYEIHGFGDNKKIRQMENPHKKIIALSVGDNHQIIVTSDHLIYSWGDNKYGQLGVGDSSNFRKYPSSINYLRDHSIISCAAGQDFSLFLSKSGKLYSCGNGNTGCLGQGNWNNVLTPLAIMSLAAFDISDICCGSHHVVALTTDGRIFSWGSSLHGELGQGHVQSRNKPVFVTLPINIEKIFCCENASAILTTTKQILVCGHNNYNKLGISSEENITTFRKIPVISSRLISVSMGRNSTLLLTENRDILVLGLQNGSGANFEQPQTIKFDAPVSMTISGPTFNAAVDNRNVIWFWGSYIYNKDGYSYTSFDSQKTLTNLKISDKSWSKLKDHDSGIANADEEYRCVSKPESILALYSSPDNVKDGKIIQVGDIKANKRSLYIIVNTTTPPPLKTFSNTDIQNTQFVSQTANTDYFAKTELPNTPRWT